MTWRDELYGFFSLAVGVLLVSLITATLASGASLDSYYQRINEFRAADTNIDGSPKDPLPPYVVHPALEKAASNYAKWCSRNVPRNQSWGHYADGSTPTERARAAGFLDPDESAPFGYYGGVAECTMNPPKVDPIWKWTMSDPHRAVLLLDYGERDLYMGLGYASGPRGGWVLDVGWRAPLTEPRAGAIQPAAQKPCVGGT